MSGAGRPWMDASRIAVESAAVLSKGFARYLRLSQSHASQMLDLGKSVWSDFLASYECPPRGRDGAAPGQTVSELSLSGSPGGLCRSAFVLESNKALPVRARVACSPFVNDNGGAAAPIPVVFDPAEASVAPGEKIRIAVEAGVPEGLAAGSYHAMAWIEGFPELSLRVTLAVSPAAPLHEASARGEAKTAASKKSGGK